MKPAKEGGSRIAIVFNGSPPFTGDAASGESEIRRWILENDWREAIVAMPDQLFYNTGIFTYVWIVTIRKLTHRLSRIDLACHAHLNKLRHIEPSASGFAPGHPPLALLDPVRQLALG